jgi:esterase/lipase superfamily enzyme
MYRLAMEKRVEEEGQREMAKAAARKPEMLEGGSPSVTPRDLPLGVPGPSAPQTTPIPEMTPPPPPPAPAMAPPSPVPAPAPAPEPASKDFHTVEVFYATDRQPANATGGPKDSYGVERNRQGPVEYGRTEVSIPLHHSMGIIERPHWYKLEFSEDPKKHVMILKLEKMAGDQFFGRLGDTAKGKPLKEGLLFIHGFNVPFDQAIRRTAQISYDLDFGGVALTYSWPSQGVLTGYTVDEENVQWSIPHLSKFLVDLQEKTHLDKIHVIAHSMGTRLLSYALANARDAGFRLQLNNVILAAPDIDAEVFKEQILPKIRGSAQRLTMYASSGDAALKASQEIHGNDRLGLSGKNIMVLDGMDTVDASEIDTSLLGHAYYGTQKVVVEDLLELIIRGLDPARRKLTPGKIGEWDFKSLAQ